MNSVLSFIAGLSLGWFLAPAFTDIIRKIIQEIKDWRYR